MIVSFFVVDEERLKAVQEKVESLGAEYRQKREKIEKLGTIGREVYEQVKILETESVRSLFQCSIFSFPSTSSLTILSFDREQKTMTAEREELRQARQLWFRAKTKLGKLRISLYNLSKLMRFLGCFTDVARQNLARELDQQRNNSGQKKRDAIARDLKKVMTKRVKLALEYKVRNFVSLDPFDLRLILHNHCRTELCPRNRTTTKLCC